MSELKLRSLTVNNIRVIVCFLQEYLLLYIIRQPRAKYDRKMYVKVPIHPYQAKNNKIATNQDTTRCERRQTITNIPRD